MTIIISIDVVAIENPEVADSRKRGTLTDKAMPRPRRVILIRMNEANVRLPGASEAKSVSTTLTRPYAGKSENSDNFACLDHLPGSLPSGFHSNVK